MRPRPSAGVVVGVAGLASGLRAAVAAALVSACASGEPGSGFNPGALASGAGTDDGEEETEGESSTHGELADGSSDDGAADESEGGNDPPEGCIPAAETCNGVDDDCDGTIDEDLSGPCSSACGVGIESCVAGTMICDAAPEVETCNFADDDCDGTIDEGVNGCLVGVHRSFHHTTVEHLYTTNLAEATSGGFDLLAEDYFFVYADEHPGLVALYRCIKSNGKRVYTQSADCEGETLEGVLGYVAPASSATAVPLHRLFHAGQGDHTLLRYQDEVDHAIDNVGYEYEQIVGYVF